MKKEVYEIYYRNVRNTHPAMPDIVKLLKKTKSPKILDFCCGNGRNIVYFAEKGFDIYGFDWSKDGIKETKERLKDKKLKAHLTVCSMFDPLPYDNDYFEAVIAVRALYHGRLSQLKKIIKEVARVTKKDGILFWHGATYGDYDNIIKSGQKLKKLEPNTYVGTIGQYKGVIKHYFSKTEAVSFLKPYYKIKKIRTDQTTFSIIAQKK